MNQANPWVYVFAKFTHEALLFEGLAIFTLSTLYAAFWIGTKRRYGVLGSARGAHPGANAVQAYLSHLIGDAQEIRTQLFGLKGAANFSGQSPAAWEPRPTGPVGAPISDDGTATKLAALETRLREQADALEALSALKIRLEQELTALRQAGATGGATAPSAFTETEIPALQAKVQELEGKLQEYSVIEDDLANLKRMQQENAALRASLGPKADAIAAMATAAPSAPAKSAPAAVSAPTSPAFESLVNDVEQSLQPAPVSAAPASATAAAGASVAATPAAAAPETPAITLDKSDADIVAEFEKLIDG